MKNRYILLLLFSFTLTCLIGQSNWRFSPSFTIGYSGKRVYEERSYGEPTIIYDGIVEKKLLPSLGLGFTAERLIKKRWGVNLSFQYNYNQFFERNEDNYYSNLEALTSYNEYRNTFSNHQLSAPIDLHFYLGKQDGIRPYLSIGGQVSYLISAIDVGGNIGASNGEARENSWRNKYNIKSKWSSLKRFNIGMKYAVGVAFKQFSLEISRVPSNIKKSGSNGTCYGCFQVGIVPTTEKIQLTNLTIRYYL